MGVAKESKRVGDHGGADSMASERNDSQPLLSEPQASSKGRKWVKQWVPQDTVLHPGKCFLMKWVTEDFLKSLQEKHPEVEQEAEEEYEVVYLCNFEGCGKIFTEQGALRKHAHVHGEKQFTCHYEGCGKRFMDSSKLRRHFLIHTGEKHFVCPVDGCGKAFSLDFNLRSHMRTHTQENYHICPFEDCGKRYAHEYKLRAHLKSYHDKSIPPDVKLTPPQQVEMEVLPSKTTHSAPSSVNLDRPFACPYNGCDKRYIHEYKLNLHLRKEHAQEEALEETTKTGKSYETEDMDEGSERELDTHANKVGLIQGSGRGKLQIISKSAASKGARRKRGTTISVDVNPKVQPGSRPGKKKEVAKRGRHVESEETEEEEQEDTEEDDIDRLMQVRADDDDDEETEDDME